MRHRSRALATALAVTLAAATQIAAHAPLPGAPAAAAAPAAASAVDQNALTAFYQANDASKGWVDLSQTDVSYLRAAQAALSSGMSVGPTDAYHGNPVAGWTSTSQSFTWTVKNTTAQKFDVSTLIANAEGTVTVAAGSSQVSRTYSQKDAGWNKVGYGAVTVPAGTSTITVRATAGSGFSMGLLGLELTPASRTAQINAAVAAGRSKATWMKSDPVGVFYQWGQWGAYPDGTEPAWPTVYERADFNALASRVKSMGAGYVVWSITWTQYYMAAPVSSVDAVLGGRTTQHDYLQDMLTAFHNQGLRVMFYYHPGHDNNPNLDWWKAFWTVPSGGWFARKESAIGKWLDIVTEIGNRYGTQLDGWMFDDGATYYPAPYATVNTAVRAGNPDRMVSFNSGANAGTAPRLTDYMDFAFGENNTGSLYPLTGDGTIASGGYAGEQGFGNVRLDNGDWGVRTGDTAPITPALSQATLTTITQKAHDTHQSIAFGMRMWSDLTQGKDSMAYLTAADNAWAAVRTGTGIDDATGIYTGTWQTNNPGGCAAGTCHNSKTAGSTAQAGFAGTGITWFGITGPDQGQAEVYVDGVLDRTVNLYNPVRATNTPVFTRTGLAAGNHTIRIVTKNTAWVTVDRFVVAS